MNSRIILATHNLHKVEELRHMLSDFPIDICSMREFPGIPEPDETGSTFAENAAIKAIAATLFTGLPALADDSGICVDALDGAPGVYSARWAGTGSTADDWITKTLDLMNDVEESQRTGRYVCALCLTSASGDVIAETEGTMEGRIGYSPIGTGGFGYDPIFLVSPDFNRTAAQLTAEEKHSISHRGVALRKMMDVIRTTNLLG
ncbi:MAG: RdgB/HAM1 family non-canonical purine NTP pyrophosphatase [Armatimonadota bacterium]